MSEFVSWIEKAIKGKKKIFFLTGKQIFHTKKGEKLQKELHGDFIGHSAIRFYYDLTDTSQRGRLYEKECTNFSTPNRFPTIIVRAMKRGGFKDFASIPEGLLLPCIFAKWQLERDAVNAKRQPEWDAVNAKWQPERDAVNAKWQPERDAVNAKRQLEWDAVNAKRQLEWDAVNAKFWDLFAIPENRNPAWK